jgi:hypothetical protein
LILPVIFLKEKKENELRRKGFVKPFFNHSLLRKRERLWRVLRVTGAMSNGVTRHSVTKMRRIQDLSSEPTVAEKGKWQAGKKECCILLMDSMPRSCALGHHMIVPCDNIIIA